VNSVAAVSDTTQAISAGLAGLAIVLQVLLVVLALTALLALVWAPPRRALAALRDGLGGGELWLAFAVAAVATAGSLYFSEAAHFVPCRLCWFQRIAMYPLVPLLLIAALRKDFRGGAIYSLPIALIGAGISIYHIYIENNPGAESAGCRATAPCSTKWIDEFGYVTIPTLALTAFLTIAVLAVFALRRTSAEDREAPALREPLDTAL
jgi:disulfide bond formation protein DsbB